MPIRITRNTRRFLSKGEGRYVHAGARVHMAALTKIGRAMLAQARRSYETGNYRHATKLQKAAAHIRKALDLAF